MESETTMKSYRLTANRKDTPDEVVIAESIRSAVGKFTKFLEYFAEDGSDNEDYVCNLLPQTEVTVSDNSGTITIQSDTYTVTEEVSAEKLRQVKRKDGTVVNITYTDLCRQLGFTAEKPVFKITSRRSITYSGSRSDIPALWDLLNAVIVSDYVPAKSLLTALGLEY